MLPTPSPRRETIMLALQAAILAKVPSSFVGNTAAGNPQITGIPDTTGLFPGLPIAGGTTPEQSLIRTIDGPNALTVTIPPTGDATGVVFDTGFGTISRRVIPWTDNPPQPCLFLINESDDYQVRTQQPPIRTMKIEVMIYTDVGRDKSMAAGVTLNNFADALDAAIPYSDSQWGRNTLGGIVQDCRINGAMEYYPGDLASQAIGVATVLITIP